MNSSTVTYYIGISEYSRFIKLLSKIDGDSSTQITRNCKMNPKQYYELMYYIYHHAFVNFGNILDTVRDEDNKMDIDLVQLNISFQLDIKLNLIDEIIIYEDIYYDDDIVKKY